VVPGWGFRDALTDRKRQNGLWPVGETQRRLNGGHTSSRESVMFRRLTVVLRLSRVS